MMYYVYRIETNDITRYIGYTEDITTRQKQHNYLCFKKNKKKKFYDNVKNIHPDIKSFDLKIIKTFRTKIEAKRWECFLILNDYFNKKELWQNVPKITDM